jgi:hypothetical protein
LNNRGALEEQAAVQLAAVQQKIVKTAEVSIDVKDGTFDRAVQQATNVAAGHGGYVATTRTASTKRASGTLVLRIPADQFEAALGELRALGKVRAQQVSGQDVTAQYVDLQARLRNWEAQETVLLGLMQHATSIADSLKVEQTLQDVQLNIEELRGQLNVLDDQTAYSTITLSMTEAGTVVPPSHPNAFQRAWHQAVHGTVAMLTAIVISVGYLVPVAFLALAGLIGWAIVRRVRARPAAATGGPTV